MHIIGLGLMAASVLGATLDAPVTAVTVYSDQAQVVRAGSVTVSGSQRVTFPRLPKNVDTDSIRVEADGAEVSHVDVRTVKGEAFSQDEARKLLARTEEVEVSLTHLLAERNAHHAQIEALRRIRPKVPGGAEAEWARTNPSDWSTAATFIMDAIAKRDSRMRELDTESETLKDEQQRNKERASTLGKTFGEPGIEVAATLTGKGAANVKLTYRTTGARWYPRYELQLQPDSQRMQMAFYGRVSQDTGEDWDGARLTLSTAQPTNASELPKLTTWKLGLQERFIPTPRPHAERTRPAPSASPHQPQTMASTEHALRAQLLRQSGQQQPPAPLTSQTPSQDAAQGPHSTLIGTTFDAQTRLPLSDVGITANSSSSESEHLTVTDAKGEYRIPSLRPGDYTLRFEHHSYKPYTRSGVQLRLNRTIRVNVELLPTALNEAIERVGAPPTIDVGSTTMSVNVDPEFIKRIAVARKDGSIEQSVSLSPPPGWRARAFDPASPAHLAGGYNLAFTSQHRETLLSGKGERALPLVSESWPVQVERKVFPALSENTYLVATLQGPSKSVFPGGDASLFVGADPAGTATLSTLVPGESFTLPLGIDPAVRTVRNVQLVESKKGFISKDTVGTYAVTIEVPNPYPFPLAVSVVDQLPLNTDGKVEVALVHAAPAVQPEAETGTLQWNVTVPPSSKSTISFHYTLSRPKGWRMFQN